jgi:hypothetical protein
MIEMLLKTKKNIKMISWVFFKHGEMTNIHLQAKIL